MRSFDYRRADGHPAAERSPGTALLAGGTDLTTLLRAGLVGPDHVVDIKSSRHLAAGVERAGGGWSIGALATLADVEDHAGLRAEATVLVEAVSEAATRQIRNRATMGGNLLQRPRCAYYRNEAVVCFMNGGDSCPAREGRNEHHAIFDTGLCVATQPSDPASALVALGAEVVLQTAGAERTVPVAGLLAPPTPDRRSLHTLGDDEVVVAVTVPGSDGERRSTYRKAMDRQAWAFALVGVAASVTVSDGIIVDAALVASGVATTPWPLSSAGAALIGSRPGPDAVDAACRRVADGAEPLAHNRYKVELLRGLTRRALTDLVGAAPSE